MATERQLQDAAKRRAAREASRAAAARRRAEEIAAAMGEPLRPLGGGNPFVDDGEDPWLFPVEKPPTSVSGS